MMISHRNRTAVQGKSRRYMYMYSKKKKKKVNFDSRFAWRLNRIKEKISLQIVLLPILLLIYMGRVYLL